MSNHPFDPNDPNNPTKDKSPVKSGSAPFNTPAFPTPVGVETKTIPPHTPDLTQGPALVSPTPRFNTPNNAPLNRTQVDDNRAPFNQPISANGNRAGVDSRTALGANDPALSQSQRSFIMDDVNKLRAEITRLRQHEQNVTPTELEALDVITQRIAVYAK